MEPDALPFVLSLNELGRDDLAIAGGKGANLGELIRAGFPVPSGYVVTTSAYDCFVAHNHLDDIIETVLRDEQGSGTSIRDAFEQATMPPEVEQSVLSTYHEIGQVPVAVRSSATAEDLPEAAFAGQQDSFLNIVGTQAVLEAVRRCWASLWTDRAMAYRKRQKFDRQTVKLAVVVQHMIAAEIAGVMFTANPVTGKRDEIVIDANPGLGEAVVSGMVTPDHFVLHKRFWGWHIVERQSGQHEVVVQPRPEGGTEHVKGTDTVMLPDRALRRLVQLGTSIQQLFGNPQDIEWAWVQGKLYIVQARPITALPAPPPQANRLVRMLAAIFAEMFPVRPYPLDQTTWLPALSHGAIDPIFSLLGISVPHIEDMMIEESEVIVRFRGQIRVGLTPGMLLAPFRLLWYASRCNPFHQESDTLLVEAVECSETELIVTLKDGRRIATPLWWLPRLFHATPEQRAGMLQLALADLPQCKLDTRELQRANVSYTVETLASLHAEVEETPLCLFLGLDAFRQLDDWHRWQELLDYCHLVVVDRPDMSQSTTDLQTANTSPTIQTLLSQHAVESPGPLHEQRAGCILFQTIPLLDISATRLRDSLKRNHSIRFLVPDAVLDYIQQHQLYTRKEGRRRKGGRKEVE
jgi:pyruvate,water dikinase